MPPARQESAATRPGIGWLYCAGGAIGWASATGGWGGCPGPNDALDLVDSVILSADREQRGACGQVYRVDDTLHLGGHRDIGAGGIGADHRHLVGSGRPLRAVIALAVPDEAR